MSSLISSMSMCSISMSLKISTSSDDVGEWLGGGVKALEGDD